MADKYFSKLENALQQELAKLFLKEIDFPKGCLVTIIKVEINRKQNKTLVYLDILPFCFSAKVINNLNKRARYFEFFLKKRLNKKTISPIVFLLYETED